MVCHRAPQSSGRVGQPHWAGRTHHWLSRGRAGSILSPTKGPGSAVSVFVFLRLLEPCLRAALAFSSLQGEVRPYPSPSEGPARQTDRQTDITGWDPELPQAGRVRAISITLGHLTLPHPPALSKGRAALGLTAVPRLEPVAEPMEDISREVSKVQVVLLIQK